MNYEYVDITRSGEMANMYFQATSLRYTEANFREK